MLRALEDDAAGPTEAIAHEACAALALEDEAAEGDELFQPVVAFEELRPEREEQAPQPELAMGGSEVEGMCQGLGFMWAIVSGMTMTF